MIVFISGGVRSGKSAIAEEYVRKLASCENVVHYIATAQAVDDEMKMRIAYHQEQRARQSLRWMTWERSVGLHELATRFGSNDVVLLDCLTNLLANELFSDEGWKQEDTCFQKARGIFEAVVQLAAHSKALVIVSNELFSGSVPEDMGTYHFMKTLGWLHQQIVTRASIAILAQHGIPLVKKGEAV
ncbi:bifunctional adenosylcobinamide kinase/adenosylcobinamide-phosphate guanylyltransferase [Thermaerobacillus caldiproteolyticus]|uniref:Adenosylcobinamide kinase n=1 Tax=Thermaerobacillus caldiproteolyticus TaxID=247480 RepID=A0A7V9Z3A9_9BACL|nr:bifunctional adenosylcobinamide kinase/adenosylcobinamide-phosphate guanylyltransferase [Anoxybacillus caldiproteolyticus]MBA2873269.1 adenosylcobinamide kinase/adenosylcobinamide-phosphate guanylyltransferase [Anoxybacillus caldiproteolyticus]QPA29888.1 bifunctional adenosylcobinamide kinase/adenosylcobinamide-phosphate guanylyltransferase [Anoxybacillus caldiproteolyticus]